MANGLHQYCFRVVEEDFGKSSQLSRDLQRSNAVRFLRISDTGLQIMAAMADARVDEWQLGILGRSLRGIMGNSGPARPGNTFTSIYGEVFGPLITTMEKNADFLVIRLIPADGQACADFLLLDRHTQTMILQECKATYCTVDGANDQLDVCATIHERKREGRQQLRWPDLGSIGPDAVAVSPADALGKQLGCDELSVAVTALPDGALRRYRAVLKAPPRRACSQNCVEGCLTCPAVTLVTAIFAEPVAHAQQNAVEQTRRFLQAYKRTGKAIWAKASAMFNRSYKELLASCPVDNAEMGDDDGPTVLMHYLLGPLEQAAHSGLYLDFASLERACAELRWATAEAYLLDHLPELQEFCRQSEAQPPSTGDAGALHNAVFGEDAATREAARQASIELLCQSPDGRHGFKGEAFIEESEDGTIVKLVSESNASDSTDCVKWTLSQMLVGDDTEDIRRTYDSFRDEMVMYSSDGVDVGEATQYSIGSVLRIHSDSIPLPAFVGICQAAAGIYRTGNQILSTWQQAGGSIQRLQQLMKGARDVMDGLQRYQVRRLADAHYPRCLAFATSDGRGTLIIPRWYQER